VQKSTATSSFALLGFVAEAVLGRRGNSRPPIEPRVGRRTAFLEDVSPDA
jgi:hypothetical protein